MSLTAAAACPGKPLAPAPPAPGPSRRCLCLARGPAEELGPGSRGAGSTTELPGAARGSRSSWRLSWLGSERRWEGTVLGTGNAPGLLAGGLPLSNHPSTHTPFSPALRPCSSPSKSSVQAPWPFRDHCAQPDPKHCPQPSLSPLARSSSHCSDTQGLLRPPDLTHSTDPASLSVPGVLPFCTGHQIPCELSGPLCPPKCVLMSPLHTHTRNRLTLDLDTEQHCRRKREKIFIIQTIQPSPSQCQPCPAHTVLVSSLAPGPLWPCGDFVHPRAAHGD